MTAFSDAEVTPHRDHPTGQALSKIDSVASTTHQQGLRTCRVFLPGVVNYGQAWRWQQQYVEKRKASPHLEDVLLVMQHPPVYTLGQGADMSYVKFDPDLHEYELYRVERGGEVTYHCLGQLVGYPILNLNFYRKDLHWYLRQLEEVIIQVLANYNLQGTRIDGLTGVWVKGYKVAAIGIKVSRWITMHGFALNVNPDLDGFRQIVPCGICDRPVGSLAQFIPDLTPDAVQPVLLQAFSQVLGVELRSGDPATLLEQPGLRSPA